MICVAAFSAVERGKTDCIIGIFQIGAHSFQAGATIGPRFPFAWSWRALPALGETIEECKASMRATVSEDFDLIPRESPYWREDECTPELRYCRTIESALAARKVA